MVIRTFEILSATDSSQYEHFKVHIKQAYRRTLPRKQAQIMETVNVMGRNNKRALLYWEGEVDEKLVRKDEIMEKLKGVGHISR